MLIPKHDCHMTHWNVRNSNPNTAHLPAKMQPQQHCCHISIPTQMVPSNMRNSYLWPLSVVSLYCCRRLWCLWQLNDSRSGGGCRMMCVVLIVEVRLQCCGGCGGTSGEQSACLGCWGCVSCNRDLCRHGSGCNGRRQAVQWFHVGIIHYNTCCSATTAFRYLTRAAHS